VEAAEHHSAGGEGDRLGPERRSALCDRVGVYELGHRQGAAEESRCRRALAGPFGPATTTTRGSFIADRIVHDPRDKSSTSTVVRARVRGGQPIGSSPNLRRN
jgi:hypothetical protein